MLKVNFPFKIDDEISTTNIKTYIERKENIISFSLEYKMNLKIENSTCISIQKYNESYIYIFEFSDINNAIEFENIKECTVENSSTFSNPLEIEKEIINYAENYINQKNNRKIKKKLVEDDDGFKRYI